MRRKGYERVIMLSHWCDISFTNVCYRVILSLVKGESGEGSLEGSLANSLFHSLEVDNTIGLPFHENLLAHQKQLHCPNLSLAWICCKAHPSREKDAISFACYEEPTPSW